MADNFVLGLSHLKLLGQLLNCGVRAVMEVAHVVVWEII